MSESSSSSGRELLMKWLNRPMCIQLTDGRKVVGTFLCTDRDSNIILGQTREYWPQNTDGVGQEIDNTQSDVPDEPRILGLTMVPGKHIVEIHVNNSPPSTAPVAANYFIPNGPGQADVVDEENQDGSTVDCQKNIYTSPSSQ